MTANTRKAYDPRFQLAVVMVRDQDRSLRLYVEQLGFQLVFDDPLPSGFRWIVVEPLDRSLLVGQEHFVGFHVSWVRIHEL